MNGNGITFDYSNDSEFKAYVVTQLGKLDGLKQNADKVPVIEQAFKDLRREYDDSQKWNNIKSFAGPVLVALHVAARSLGIKI